ncbi:MAG: PKD domain-containing protein [Rhodothermales bacterium]|nr:PKD domain-containing protein [Rhodothermales bacterium]
MYSIGGDKTAVSGQFVKLGASVSGNPGITIERSPVAAKTSVAQASTVSVTVARLGYQPLEQLYEVDNGATVQAFLTKQEISSDFGFTATALHVSFENQSTGADTFDWDFGDGSGSSEENPVHLFSTEGDYSVSLVASIDGAVDSTEKLVSVTATAGDNAMVPMDRTDLYDVGASYYGEAYAWPNDPSPVPVGSVIVGTGYSNASQHFNTYDAQYQSLMNPEFINCGVGSNAIENWIGQNTVTLFSDCIAEVEAAGYTAADVGLTINLVANQILYPAFPEPGSGVDTLETQVQELGALLEQYFPNAINTYTTGEPAHWVEPSKCPRICEPIRFETALGVNRALKHMDPDKHIHGAYLWSAIGIPNGSGETWVIEDFLAPTGDGYANQHPSDQGREKASRIYHAFFSEKYPTWYPVQ